jgi:class 3 adenylate cyclase
VADLPTGTVTFVFTDVEGSTRLWEEHPDAMQGALSFGSDTTR